MDKRPRESIAVAGSILLLSLAYSSTVALGSDSPHIFTFQDATLDLLAMLAVTADEALWRRWMCHTTRKRTPPLQGKGMDRPSLQ
jgi:hypothetical protein